ncbi:MAG: flagellar hook-length control protein FliK, partial [candidate division Zixibacteria bacterium]|nr:flagellar hook-length control protein FliK [candidate division Zixibacteria bacterium]
STERFSARPVRISLPETFQAASRPHSQSIMLKIEPEHLGPARLNLLMRHDTLVARVVVDSVQAKMLIERNLDTLVEQLARADINLEKIEVEVGGSGAESGQFERRMLWSQRNRAAILMRGNETDAESAIITPSIYQAPRTYVGESGVNLLA